ncbi:hypothetical protein QBC45DRAFT_429187 [Copromyces sp. CBS 386.78]|nr:hypothetical protein QBC45DRAFT_429187 [Copromyces sp. CBS 386.78]
MTVDAMQNGVVNIARVLGLFTTWKIMLVMISISLGAKNCSRQVQFNSVVEKVQFEFQDRHLNFLVPHGPFSTWPIGSLIIHTINACSPDINAHYPNVTDDYPNSR